MKARVLVYVCCLLVVVVNASKAVANITVLSETHRVWGWAHDYAEYTSYDHTDTVPVTGYCEGWCEFPGYYTGLNSACSTAGNFAVEASITPGFSLFATLAGAESTYVFKPDTDWLSISFTGERLGTEDISTYVTYSLTDLTHNNLVDLRSTVGLPFEYYAVDWQENYVVDPLHEYQLWLKAFNGNNDSGTTFARLQACIYVIPAPEALVLGLIGAGLLGCLRRFGIL
ncbi:MAG TPA: hypothetical protein VMW16_13900 [Sedimentisphaerales bacterium]|nr:hypothetical protein [Sedimentisphaerales bacterium]